MAGMERARTHRAAIIADVALPRELVDDIRQFAAALQLRHDFLRELIAAAGADATLSLWSPRG